MRGRGWRKPCAFGFAAALGLLLAPLGGCGGSGGDEGESGGSGACVVAGSGILATCYQDYEYCGSSSSHTFHGGATCPQVGYGLACCYSSDPPTYWRPSGGSCDANDRDCAQAPPTQDACSRCLSTCSGDPLCCTGSGCYCEDECA